MRHTCDFIVVQRGKTALNMAWEIPAAPSRKIWVYRANACGANGAKKAGG